jgi:hypothetical protein
MSVSVIRKVRSVRVRVRLRTRFIATYMSVSVTFNIENASVSVSVKNVRVEPYNPYTYIFLLNLIKCVACMDLDMDLILYIPPRYYIFLHDTIYSSTILYIARPRRLLSRAAPICVCAEPRRACASGAISSSRYFVR